MAQTLKDYERSLIGTLLLHPARIAEAMQLGLSADWFSDDAAGLLWSALERSHRNGDAEELQPAALLDSARRMADAGGKRRDGSSLNYAYLERCIDVGGFDRSVGSILAPLRNAYVEKKANEILAGAMAGFSKWADARDPLIDLRGQIDSLVSSIDDAGKDGRGDMTFYDLPDALPEKDNPRALLGNGYLRKGHGMMIVSTSGAGKSVFSVQMLLHFAIGRPFFGMRPVRPLKIGLIQAEDDAEEMSGFRSNMRRAFTQDFGWSDGDFDTALRGVTITGRFVGKTGSAFLDELRCWQMSNRFDVVVVNPLFSYFGGDLSNGHDVAGFFREGIDPMIKNADWGFGIVFIHHAIKPPKDAESRKSWGADAFAQYIGAGSTDVAGWSRSSLIIMPVSGHYGWARLIAAKRGGRLGWTDSNGSSVQEKIIAYGRNGGIYWREPCDAEIPDDVRKAAAIDAKPFEIGEDEARQKMLAHLKVQPMRTTDFFNWCKTQFKGMTSRQEVPASRAYKSIVNAPYKYGIEKVKVQGGAYLLRAQGFLAGADGNMMMKEGATGSGRSGGASIVGDYGLDGGDELDEVLDNT